MFIQTRFLQIWHYFHLVDNESLAKHGKSGYNKIGKVRVFLDAIAANCKNEYWLDQEVTIDETMVAQRQNLPQIIFEGKASKVENKTLGSVRIQNWICLLIFLRGRRMGKQRNTLHIVLSVTYFSILTILETMCVWTITTLTLICSLNYSREEYMLVGPFVPKGLDFLKY